MPISHNIADLRRGLDNATRLQIPSTISVAVNRTLADVKKNTGKRMMCVLDSWTPS